MTTHHTPGPWSIKTTFAHNWIGIVSEDGQDLETLICYTERNNATIDSSAEADANTRLISAAPDLLQALQGVLRVADRDTVEFNAARAAIAKSTGKEIV